MNVMDIKRIDNETDLWFAQQLYLKSFPEDERRELEEWVNMTHSEPKFFNNVITEDSHNVGMITFWDFPAFVYVEHFAIDAAIRGKGLGGRALEMFLSDKTKPVVLEVEPPVGDMEQRRIAFYERYGFKVCNKKYIQPPYRENGNSLDLKIMYYGCGDIEDLFDRMVTTIYKHVYKQEGRIL